MNAGTIWWEQIGTSLRFLQEITNNLRDCRSAILQVPKRLPWRNCFYDAVDFRRASFSGERRLRRVTWDANLEPGEFVLDELCSNKVRAEYWPGTTYAAYLGSRKDIVLCEYYVWVTGIHNKADLAKWADFVAEYIRVSGDTAQSAVFVLEYDGVSCDVSEIQVIDYSIHNYDCRVFALEVSAVLNNTDLPEYQSELALHISKLNPEFCFDLLQSGKCLLDDPVRAAVNIGTSNAIESSMLDEQRLASATWETAVVLLFPVLERLRTDFIARNISKVSTYLPISNSYGETIADPHDLEVGQLYHIATASSISLSGDDVDLIRLCRFVRNQLAHNKAVPYNDIKKLLTLVSAV